MESIDLETFAKIFYYLIVPFSMIGVTLWAIIKFSFRKEHAALKVKINKVTVKTLKDGNKYIHVVVVIKNVGKRDLVIQYSKALIKLATLDNDGDNFNDIIDQKQGQLSIPKQNFGTGRLRPKVKIRLPYWMKTNNEGLHLIEFSIGIGMKKYFRFDKDKNIKIWSDRKLIYLNE